MIDIHSHLLPMVDDGSVSTELSLALLKKAERKGVTDVVLTPHYKGKYRKTSKEIIERYKEFNKSKSLLNINVNLHLGMEIQYSPNVLSKLKTGELITLNGTKYVLIEIGHNNLVDVTEVAYEFIREGFVPIFAHVERYGHITTKDIEEIKKLGGLIQVNARSVVYKGTRRRRKRTRKLIRHSLVDFIASDEHCGRTNYIVKAYKYVKRHYGKQVAKKLFCENAKKITTKG